MEEDIIKGPGGDEDTVEATGYCLKCGVIHIGACPFDETPEST